MTARGSECVLVVLNVTPGLEEPVVDWLLSRSDEVGFTSSVAYGHGADAIGLSVAEQVTGRRRRLLFEVAMLRSQCPLFLDEAAEQFGTADVRVTVLPILATGLLAEVRHALDAPD